MKQAFTVLNNQAIGKNLTMYRVLRNIKAVQIADHIGISESQYTKYERGQSKITLEVIQKASEILEVDPVSIITTNPGSFIDNSYATNSVVGSHVVGDVRLIDEKQTALITKLIESTITMNDKIIALLGKQRKEKRPPSRTLKKS